LLGEEAATMFLCIELADAGVIVHWHAKGKLFGF